MNKRQSVLWSALLLAAGWNTLAGLPAVAAPANSPELQALIDRQLGEGDVLLIGAGDIADCRKKPVHAEETAALIELFPAARVFAAGDIAYGNGKKAEFRDCYDKSWGRFKERTWPSPGNHDYGVEQFFKRHDAKPYFAYFGENAGTPELGYYSKDLGQWHLISLNSMAGQEGAPKMEDQVAWLEQDLADNQQPCLLAFWHHPLFSSGEHGTDEKDFGRSMHRLWKPLLEHHADVILNGHDHDYERFGLQDVERNKTDAGIRQFVVGTGGGKARDKILDLEPNSEKHFDDAFGVLLLTLHPNSYEWHFITTDRKVLDSGTTQCH